MIPAIGQLALILSFLAAIALASAPLLYSFGTKRQVLGYSSMVLLVESLALTAAFSILIYSHIISDFSVANVVQNSHTSKPLIYKISGVWGNHEGSMLLWGWMLVMFTAAFAVFSPADSIFKTGVLSVQGVLSAGFLAFIIYTSNPFARIFPPALEGEGLNPLLQDIGLALHPPCLYIGYVGFSLGFSAAITALVLGRGNVLWASYLKPWVLFSWSFLTVGIALGSWWAYRELGWGGFWFWDPVENASLMPWLTGTALLHSLIVLEKRQHLQSWTLLLAITTFSLSLLGTFLVRSGVLTSVHSFASDPARGFFILLFLTIVIGTSLTLFAFRASRLKSSGGFAVLSRESFILFNNLLLLTACSTILLGTLYPIFYELLVGGKLSIGAPYFASTFIPIALPLLGLAAIGSLLKWKQDKLQGKNFVMAALALIPAVMSVFWLGQFTWLAFAGIWFAAWLIVAMGAEWARRVHLFAKPLPESIKLARQIPASFYAMIIAHTGVALLTVGVTVAVTGFQEKEQLMQLGDTVSIAGYHVAFNGVSYHTGPNYMLRRAMLYVETVNGDEITTLMPEVRFYPVEKSQTTESAVYSHLFSDIYAAMGEVDDKGGAVIRMYYRPLISLIWGGALLMALGGMLACGRRAPKP